VKSLGWRVYHRPFSMKLPSVFLGLVTAEDREAALQIAKETWPARTLDLISTLAWACLDTRSKAILEGTLPNEEEDERPFTQIAPGVREAACLKCGQPIRYYRTTRWRNPPEYHPECQPVTKNALRLRVRKLNRSTECQTTQTSPVCQPTRTTPIP